MSKIKKRYLDFEIYEQSEVTTISGDIVDQIVTDHGALTGLADDDHTQYLLVTDFTTSSGDILTYVSDNYIDNSEMTTISGDLQTNIDGKDNYASWSFAVDGVTKDAITSADILNFVGGDNITITRSADDEITISGSAGGGGASDHGDLTGLSDDDHTQYLLADGTRTLTGELTISGSGIDLEHTTTDATGIIFKAGARFIHNFKHPTGSGAVPAGQNTFIGENAGNFTMGSTATATTHGSYSVAVGHSALQDNTIGHSNSAVGNFSLQSNTESYYNSAIGLSSLRSNTTGMANSAVGVDSLRSNTEGYYNSAIGFNSGRYISGGVNTNIISNSSVYLGVNTKALASGDTNEIVIGYDATGIGSHSVVLGNDSITKTALKGNVGIGETDPAAKLDVDGDLILEAGVAVNEFSTDTTLSGNSDTAVPTEKAVKTYVDTEIATVSGGGGGASDHGELDGLSDDDHAQYLLVDGTREGTGNFTISGSVSIGNNLTLTSGTVTIGSAGTLEADQDSPTGSGVLGYNGHFYATKVYNAVWG